MRTQKKMTPVARILLFILLVGIIVIGYQAYQWIARPGRRAQQVFAWLRSPESHPEWMITRGERCSEAPFVMPTDGLVGFIWGDSFRPGHSHQGLDIFGGKDTGITPVYAAYDGYLTRMPEWTSSVIIRIPDDPLDPGHQIWTYYTHRAEENGTS